MISRQLKLEIERSQLENLEVLKPISGNTAIKKAKAKTRYVVKKRLTNMTVLKIITRQKVDEKLQLED